MLVKTTNYNLKRDILMMLIMEIALDFVLSIIDYQLSEEVRVWL